MAVNVTVPLVDLKFINQVAVTLVDEFDHDVDTLVLEEPYLAVFVFKFVAVHPAKVCSLLTAPLILAPVPFTEPDTVIVFFGLLI